MQVLNEVRSCLILLAKKDQLVVVWSLRRCVQPVASIRSLLEMFDLIFKIENQHLCAHSLWELRYAHSYGTRWI